MMTLTRYGLREWGGGGIIALILLAGCVFLYLHQYRTAAVIAGIVVLIAYFSLAFFFRNPVRHIPDNESFLVSPADGTVRDIEVVGDFNFPPFNGRALRIGIFLSVFNVHVNRASADLAVESVYYREGEYLDARNSECAKRNEAMTIAGTATVKGKSFPMAIRQISGAIARRIVCPVQAGNKLKRGELYGMIKFGSRTELYLPENGVTVKVKVGDHVYGGETVMAEVNEK